MGQGVGVRRDEHPRLVNPIWTIRTGRLLLTPVGWGDLPDLRALKCDPGVYGQMLGGIRTPAGVAEDLARDVTDWASRGIGMWMARAVQDGQAVGLTGVQERPDSLGMALRFAFRPKVRGKGLAREAAGAALRFAHDRAGLERVVAVAKEANLASRTVLGAIGMRLAGSFDRCGDRMLVYESRVSPRPADAWR